MWEGELLKECRGLLHGVTLQVNVGDKVGVTFRLRYGLFCPLCISICVCQINMLLLMLLSYFDKRRFQ